MFRREPQPPTFIHSPAEGRTEGQKQLLGDVRSFMAGYAPHPIFNLTGLVATFTQNAGKVQDCGGRIEMLKLSDESTVSLHWHDPPAEDFGRLVLVLLGFTQHSKMKMIQSIMAQLREEGFQVVALNQRCETAEETGQKITAPKVTCLDNFRDLYEITQHILARHPQAELSAVGFSMGGTQLLRHLGAQGAKTPFRSAVAIAPHLDVPSWARSLSSGRGKRILSYLMSQLCKQYIKATLEGTKAMELVDSATLKSAGSLQEVEQAVICPLHGYAAVDEYYEDVSPHPFLGQIAVPTLILHTEDDPWVPFDPSIIKQLRNPLLFAAASQRGGHLGWRSTDAGKGTWADSMAAQFIKAAAGHW